MNCTRTIVSASNPMRYDGTYTEIWLTVWFEEFGDEPIYDFCATPFDCERHGKELWIRAMAGEYGAIEVVPMPPMIKGMVLVLPPPRQLSQMRLPVFGSERRIENQPLLALPPPAGGDAE